MSLHALTRELKEFCESHLGALISFSPASGGCINNGGRVAGTGGEAFLKWNNSSRFPGMFLAEAKGLAELKTAKSCRIPEVLATFEGDEHDALLLEYIESGNGTAKDWRRFGIELAEIHSVGAEKFGLDHDNYMGSLQQSNRTHETFAEFFRQERLLPQIALAKSHLNAADLDHFQRVMDWIEKEMKDETPSLVHGDLWSGNAMFSSDGDPVLIDPAVSYSSRHVDLAMTTLFGGFPDAFYEGYQSHTPLVSEVRVFWDVLNLYPLLIHVNLFGSSYLAQTRQILGMF